ncbi:unnamed protein product [Caenorhabditis angaria]|uniref:C-type LECtin n=1 Tax=Caenorhabditis angaria TaxID=860376 RepID=A0A9P1N7S1_9PELO|nr:unnamed protein product [Caenorhabditis angaria]
MLLLMSFLLFSCVLFSSSLAINCPIGFDDFNESTCYKIIYERASYLDASTKCGQIGGTLISIHNAIDNAFLLKIINETTWIGLECYSNECQWDDGSGTISNYSNFYGNQIQPSVGNCVTVDSAIGKWLNTPCSSTFNFICERTPIEESCALSYSGFCYNPYTIALSENDAETVCQQECGHLVSIHSFNENSNIRTLFDANLYNYVRIGAKYDETWTDNSSWTYQNIGYKNQNFGLCYSLALTNDVVSVGKWISSKCATLLPFVCKREIGAICGTTPSPTLAPSQCVGPQFGENQGYIYSPDYPYSYFSSNQSQCTYILSTPLNSFTSVVFYDFSFDQYSSIMLYNDIEDMNPFVIFDYFNPPRGSYNSTTNTMKVVFHPRNQNTNNTKYLWSIYYFPTYLNNSVLTTTTTESPFNSTQPSQSTTKIIFTCGPSKYYVPPADIIYPNGVYLPYDQKCYYSISTSFGNRIGITFSTVDLQHSSNITVYDGASTSSSVMLYLDYYSSNGGPRTTTSNHMLIILNTRSRYDGFRAKVTNIN